MLKLEKYHVNRNKLYFSNFYDKWLTLEDVEGNARDATRLIATAAAGFHC